MWSEECKESAIIWTRAYMDKPLAGTWSRTRCSLFFVCRMSGVFEAWDLLLDQHDPVLSMKICDYPLISITAHESGDKVAIGDQNGTMYLVELSDSMVRQQKNDKSMFTVMLERETRREKIIEGKLKEMKLKQKTALEEIAMKKLRHDRQKKLEEERQLEEANRGGGPSDSCPAIAAAEDSGGEWQRILLEETALTVSKSLSFAEELESKAHKDYFAAIDQEKTARGDDPSLNYRI